MAKRKFKATLSVDGIEQLKRDLLNYKDNILQHDFTEYGSRLL
jgi:hypothetical protein